MSSEPTSAETVTDRSSVYWDNTADACTKFSHQLIHTGLDLMPKETDKDTPSAAYIKASVHLNLARMWRDLSKHTSYLKTLHDETQEMKELHTDMTKDLATLENFPEFPALLEQYIEHATQLQSVTQGRFINPETWNSAVMAMQEHVNSALQADTVPQGIIGLSNFYAPFRDKAFVNENDVYHRLSTVSLMRPSMARLGSSSTVTQPCLGLFINVKTIDTTICFPYGMIAVEGRDGQRFSRFTEGETVGYFRALENCHFRLSTFPFEAEQEGPLIKDRNAKEEKEAERRRNGIVEDEWWERKETVPEEEKKLAQLRVTFCLTSNAPSKAGRQPDSKS